VFMRAKEALIKMEFLENFLRFFLVFCGVTAVISGIVLVGFAIETWLGLVHGPVMAGLLLLSVCTFVAYVETYH